LSQLTFGTRAVEQAESILELKEWIGHANVQTTMRYLHYKSKAGAAHRLAEAFRDDADRASMPTAEHGTARPGDGERPS
jgi:integrase